MSESKESKFFGRLQAYIGNDIYHNCAQFNSVGPYKTKEEATDEIKRWFAGAVAQIRVDIDEATRVRADKTKTGKQLLQEQWKIYKSKPREVVMFTMTTLEIKGDQLTEEAIASVSE